MNPGKLLDQEFPVKLIEKDRRKRRLVFSRRSLIEEELTGIRQAFYDQRHEGDVLEGDVSSITSFGVFVNLGAMEGLVHISELSWQRNAKAKEIVAKGDHVKVKVIGIDKENNRISLSIRQTLDDPWTTAAERWTPGKVTEGTVTNLTEFGASFRNRARRRRTYPVSETSAGRASSTRKKSSKRDRRSKFRSSRPIRNASASASATSSSTTPGRMPPRSTRRMPKSP